MRPAPLAPPSRRQRRGSRAASAADAGLGPWTRSPPVSESATEQPRERKLLAPPREHATDRCRLEARACVGFAASRSEASESARARAAQARGATGASMGLAAAGATGHTVLLLPLLCHSRTLAASACLPSGPSLSPFLRDERYGTREAIELLALRVSASHPGHPCRPAAPPPYKRTVAAPSRRSVLGQPPPLREKGG